VVTCFAEDFLAAHAVEVAVPAEPEETAETGRDFAVLNGLRETPDVAPGHN